MSWLSVLPAFVVIVGLLYLPGAALAAAVGARRFLLVAVAPAVSIAAFGAAAILFPFLGLPWAALPVAVAIAATAAVIFLLRRVLHRRSHPRAPARTDAEPEAASGTTWLIAGAVAIGGLLIALQLGVGLGQPDRISQTLDAAFHLNVVRYILEHGDGSSLHITDLVLPAGRSSFYPAAWHDFVALGADLTGVTIPVAANLGNLAVAALVWPAACILLVRVLLPASRVAIVGAGVLSAALPAFPLGMLSYGVLYPYFLALAVMPIALALGFMLFGRARLGVGRLGSGRLGLLIVLLGAVLTAMGLAQPAIVFAWFACTIPLLLVLYLRYVRRHSEPSKRILASVVVGGALLAFAGAWIWVGRVGQNSPWPDYTNAVGAVFETLSYSFQGTPVAVVLSGLTIIGLVHLARHPDRLWILGMWAVAAFLFMTAAALPSWRLRAYTVGLFYRDPPRLASLLTVVALPIAVLGLVALWSFLHTRVWPRVTARLQARSHVSAARAAVGLSLVLLVVASQGAAMRDSVASLAHAYALTSDSAMVSTDELALLERLDESVPKGSVIVGNPWTGASFAYAVSGREVLNPTFNSRTDPRVPIVNAGLNEALTDPAVCDAVRALHADYVLDFGEFSRKPGKSGVKLSGGAAYVGLLDLKASGVVTPADSEGAAVLYRITACG